MITRKEITAWVNVQNDEGFTSLHLAAHRGNLVYLVYLNLIRKLSPSSKVTEPITKSRTSIVTLNLFLQINNKVLSVLHTAAQGDNPVTSVIMYVWVYF